MEIPLTVWDGLDFTCIHAVALFADIQNSVLISSALSLREYDELVCAYQQAMLDLVGKLHEQHMPLGEYHIAGDQLSLFFYDPAEVEHNFLLDGPQAVVGNDRELLIQHSSKSNQSLVYDALKAAIQLKNHWLVQRFNLERVANHQAPFELSIGMHFGRVFLRKRPDGNLRIEGYMVNLAKRVESVSRIGRYSYIMLSRDACECLKSSIVEHSQLRQRIFFHRHELDSLELKGVVRNQDVFELKYYHRLSIPFPVEAVPLYETLFSIDPSNAWAYYQLIEHYGYKLGDWETAYRLACRANVAHPRDEKIKYDLAKYHSKCGDYQMAALYCKDALVHNPDFDLAFELLARIADETGDTAGMIAYMRNSVSLSPGSPGNLMNLGIALYMDRQYDEAARYFVKGLRGYPEYISQQRVQQALADIAGHVELPADISTLL